MKKEPKSIRSVRNIRRKEPKLIQGAKKTLFIKGNKTSNTVLNFLRDIRSFRRERAVFYSRRHELLPFENKQQIEKYCEKTESPLFVFGSNSKKRPNNLVLGRTFDWKVLDMIEFGIVSYSSLQQISDNINLPYQVKPFLIFQGDLWETDPISNKVRNLLTDFFYQNNKIEGIQVDKALQIIICFSILEDKRIFMKTYETKVEGKNILEDQGKIVIQQLGPHAQLCIRRTHIADNQMWKKATHVPKVKNKKQKKNIRYDGVGNKKGKLYVDRQDLKRVNTKRRKLISKEGKSKVKTDKLTEKVENQFAPN